MSLLVLWYPAADEMIDEILRNIEQKMKISIEVLKRELATIRTGRATPALIDHIKVEYAGVPTPLNQLASVSTPGARFLVIQPWDKTSILDIEKAILASDLGLNPTSDGNTIRINIPPLSEERRQELIKITRGKAEKEKVVIRNHRRDAMDELKKLEKRKDISQDDLKRALGQLQKITDSFISDADQTERNKETELMEV